MKVVIAGGRDYKPNSFDEIIIVNMIQKHKITEVVSGGQTGADCFGEYVARKIGIPIRRFLPDWIHEGKKAGPIRNKKMAEYCDAVILLPGGKGTASMKTEAIKANKRILYESSVWEPPISESPTDIGYRK